MTEQNFGARLKAAREAAGMTQRDLATRCDVTERTLRSIETGQSDPGLSLAQRLARVLGLSLDAPAAPAAR